MTLAQIDINKELIKINKQIAMHTDLSPEFQSSLKLMILIITLLINKLGLNSQNSNLPPSKDNFRSRSSSKTSTRKKQPGGQKGHDGSTLELVEKPDEIINIKIDKRTIPKSDYKQKPPRVRQVHNIILKCVVTEYRAEVIEDIHSKLEYVARFPDTIQSQSQYGASIKSMACYFSQWQLLPYARLASLFKEYGDFNLSQGSLVNFNTEAYKRLEEFEAIAKSELLKSKVLHADETGLMINKKNHWLHTSSSKDFALFKVHKKRGKEAIDEIGIIPNYKGVLVHDCWASYFSYSCTHAVCNSHILRELNRAKELSPTLLWPNRMENLLKKIAHEQNIRDNKISKNMKTRIFKEYKLILSLGNKESPLIIKNNKKRGRTMQTYERNLLDRLITHQDSVLRSVEYEEVPFTNNRAENDIRMTKVQQKISGCFRSFKGAERFCRIRSYLLTCQLHQISASDALDILFSGNLPSFLTKY